MCHVVRKIKICFDLFASISLPACFPKNSILKIEFSRSTFSIYKSVYRFYFNIVFKWKIHIRNINCTIFDLSLRCTVELKIYYLLLGVYNNKNSILRIQ